MLHRRTVDGLDGSRRGQSRSCGNAMKRRAVEQQTDTQGRGSATRREHLYAAGGRGRGEGGRGGREGGRGGGGQGEGGRGGVLPKRLKFGSGHHRLDVGGPSHGRK